jgi:hypothetical protein
MEIIKGALYEFRIVETSKKRKKLTISDIAKLSNLPKGSVQNIFCGYVANPRIDNENKKSPAI